MSNTEELKKRYGVCQQRIITSVLEAVSRASGSPFVLHTLGRTVQIQLDARECSHLHVLYTTRPPGRTMRSPLVSNALCTNHMNRTPIPPRQMRMPDASKSVHPDVANTHTTQPKFHGVRAACVFVRVDCRESIDGQTPLRWRLPLRTRVL